MGSQPDDLGTEKVPETSSGQAGSYNAIMGRTYKNAKPGKRTGIMTDFFCVSNTNAEGTVTHKIMDLQGNVAAFLKNKEGNVKIDGVLVRHNCSDPQPGDPDKTSNFMIQIRKRFARQCGAYDEGNGTIAWKKIQDLAGVLVSFNLVERNDYLNIDTKTIQIYPQQKISAENLDKLYTEINAEFERLKAKKAATAPAPSAAPPPPNPEDDPLPF